MKTEVKTCSRCGCTNFKKLGIQLLATGKKQRYQCLSCGRVLIGEYITPYPPVEVKTPPEVEPVVQPKRGKVAPPVEPAEVKELSYESTPE